MSSTHRRKLRGFVRWMEERGIKYSESLEFVVNDNGGSGTESSDSKSRDGSRSVVHGMGVKARHDLKEGDVIGTIPKEACLTVKTSGAAGAIEGAQLGGGLALAVALMYERGRGELSPWYPYLHLFSGPVNDLPIVWPPHHVDQLLRGTELHQVVQEDKKLIEEDWKESILPLCEENPHEFPPVHFTLEDYFTAKTLISSRAFEVDEFHGYGMVPLADLFNHKTGAEDVHITDPHHDSDSDSDSDSHSHSHSHSDSDSDSKMEPMNNSSGSKRANECIAPKSNEPTLDVKEVESINGRNGVLEMILVRNVSSGSEIFNTYGNLGNAGLLHRYGFTEPENPYDIVNIDYALLTEYCMVVFSERHARNRIRLWRRYGCMPCESQESEYFEVSASGKPDLELIFCLYIVHLSDHAFNAIDMSLTRFEIAEASDDDDVHWTDKFISSTKIACEKDGQKLRGRHKAVDISAEGGRDLYEEFLTLEVCKALLWLCKRRDELYGTSSSLEEDIEHLKWVPRNADDSKQYNALSLRVYERTILRRLNLFASERIRALQSA